MSVAGATWLSGVAHGFEQAFLMFWETLWALVLGFVLSGAVQAFASRDAMQRTLGNHRAPALVRASLYGMASSSCSYAASATAKSLFAKGADFVTANVFMFASTNLVVELGIVLWVLIGWQFALSELVGGVIMIALLGLLGRRGFGDRLVAEAREHLASAAGGEPPHAACGDAPDEREALRARLRSASGWGDAATFTVADLTMLRRELVVGYLVAGFLAALVPAHVWSTLFLHGHGLATDVENALVGPLIAIASFVCSIGNVPLAAALWKGGISFGGVVAFLFADLITLPLLLVYRRYYGRRTALRMLAVFWAVISAAGLLTQWLFSAAGLVPTSRPVALGGPHLALDATTVLNAVFLVVLGVVLWASRRHGRSGSEATYARDPVCGMQVERAHAPASARDGTREVFFCSERCRERFSART